MKLIILMTLFFHSYLWANDFSLVVTPQKQIYKAGEKISVAMECPSKVGKVVFTRGKEMVNQTSDCTSKNIWSF